MSLSCIQSTNTSELLAHHLRYIWLKIIAAFISTLISLILYFREAKLRTEFYWQMKCNMPFRQMEPWLFVLRFIINILCALALARRKSTSTTLPQTQDISLSCPWPLLLLFGRLDDCFDWSLLSSLPSGLSIHQMAVLNGGHKKVKLLMTSKEYKSF